MEVTDTSGMDQGDVSRLEARASFGDCQVSTLERYLAAIGGRLELVATFGDKKIIITGVEAASAGTSANKPLKRSYGVQAKRTGTDRFSLGTRDPFRRKK